MLQVPIMVGNEKKKIPHVFDHYFYRTVNERSESDA